MEPCRPCRSLRPCGGLLEPALECLQLPPSACRLVEFPDNATSVSVDVEFTSLLGAGPEAFDVQPTQLVFTLDNVEETQNVTVSFGALLRCGP